jgi:hypothetical protein
MLVASTTPVPKRMRTVSPAAWARLRPAVTGPVRRVRTATTSESDPPRRQRAASPVRIQDATDAPRAGHHDQRPSQVEDRAPERGERLCAASAAKGPSGVPEPK